MRASILLVVFGLMVAIGSVSADVQCFVDPCRAPVANGTCVYGCKPDYSTGCNFQCLAAPTSSDVTICPLAKCSADAITTGCNGVECPTGTTCGADWCFKCSVRCNPIPTPTPTPTLPTPTPTPSAKPTVACLVDPCKGPIAAGICKYGCKADYTNGCNYQCLAPPTFNNQTICPQVLCKEEVIAQQCQNVECPFGSTCGADWCNRCSSRCNPFCSNGNAPKTCVRATTGCRFACKTGYSCQPDPCNDCQSTCLKKCANGNTPKQCPSMNGVCNMLCLNGKTCQANPCDDCKPACL